MRKTKDFDILIDENNQLISVYENHEEIPYEAGEFADLILSKIVEFRAPYDGKLRKNEFNFSRKTICSIFVKENGKYSDDSFVTVRFIPPSNKEEFEVINASLFLLDNYRAYCQQVHDELKRFSIEIDNNYLNWSFNASEHKKYWFYY